MGKKNTATEVAVVPAVPAEVQGNVATVDNLLSQAVAQGLPIEQMERLLAMREKMLAERARAAFIQAMAQFQADCPVIEKTKVVLNKDGKTQRYRYAPMDSIVKQIQGPLGKAQLSYRFEVEQKPEVKEIKVICHLTHVLGHTESSYFSVPIGSSEFMTSPQAFASALTFAKRYSLLNLLGISTGDEDTDATDVKKEAAPRSEKSKIVFLLRTLGVPHKTQPEIAAGVEKFTGLMLNDKNLEAIVVKLEAAVRQNNLDAGTVTID